MSSTNKTTNLNLNSWIGADKPQREDFNRDNSILDEAIHTHRSDSAIHITGEERTAWNTPYAVGTYFGNGSASRSVTLNCAFEPRFGIVFAVNLPTGISDFTNHAHYNYLALVTKSGSSTGVMLNGKTLNVAQSSVPVHTSEYKSFNETGTTYVYVVFR